ncbi:MAG: hypothetical protein Q9159_004815 [Coniocarpon cinnabarinum]
MASTVYKTRLRSVWRSLVSPQWHRKGLWNNRIDCRVTAFVRTFQTNKCLQEYPKEGVFQPNSPTRPLPQTPSHPNTYFPQQIQPQSPHYSPEPPPQPPPAFSRSRTSVTLSYATRALFFITFCGVGFVYLTSEGLARAPIPFPPGSSEDQEELKLLAEEHDALPLVQDLRSIYRVDPSTGHRERLWKEWIAYRGLSDPTSTSASLERREHMLSTGPLKGSQGLAAQSVFYNERSGQVMVFVNFGEGCCGWPGVVHGGAVATLMDEGLGRVAAKSAAWDASSCSDATEQRSSQMNENGASLKRSVVTARLEMNYLEKVEPGQWFVLLGQLSERADTSPVSDDVFAYEVRNDTSADSPSRTSFTGSGAWHRQHGFDRSAATPSSNASNPVSAPSAHLVTSPLTGSQPNQTLKDQTGSASEKHDEISLGFRRSTDRKKYAIGTLLCCSELGPNIQDIVEVFGQAEASKSDDANQLPPNGQGGVHVHAIGQGLWIVNDEIPPPPDEF